jgi:hypothetical protein
MTNFVSAFALIISVVGISLTAIVQVKSEAHDKELYQKFKQDIDKDCNTATKRITGNISNESA